MATFPLQSHLCYDNRVTQLWKDDNREAQGEVMKREGDKPAVIAGRYEVVRPLGRGGMGKVFLVEDRETGRRLAMKILRDRWLYNDRVIARFEREVAALRQLNHPCISKIYDARRSGDMLFFTMEYVEGKSIHQWIRDRGYIGLGSTVRVLCLVAHALEHAHRITIHRDISPDNIMVLKDGSVRVLDFGLAKLRDANQALTMIGVNMGKIQYSAPEQRVNAATVDHRADIYSLGVMFFEMLTGQLPDGKTRITDIRPELPPECDAFARKAMAERPEDRFADAGEFHRSLLELYQRHEAEKRRQAARQARFPWNMLARFQSVCNRLRRTPPAVQPESREST